MAAAHPDQLVFDLLALADADVGQLRCRLADRRQIPPGGAERLLKALVVHGLDERALLPAAALALELDDDASRDRRPA